MNEKIKIVVADDHAMFRQGIISLLKFDSGIVVIGEAANGRELLMLLNKVKPHVVLLDIQMPIMNGTRALEAIIQRLPDLLIIMVSMEFNGFILQEYIRKGVHGFVPKGCDIEVLIEAIYQVKKYGNCFALSQALIDKQNAEALKTFKNDFVLSAREIEVLRLTCKGKANKEIAAMLKIAGRTVEFHKTNIYLKTGLSSPADLISYGIKNGLDVL